MSLQRPSKIAENMADVMRLVSAGKLADATALIQRHLHGSGSLPGRGEPAASMDSEPVALDAAPAAALLPAAQVVQRAPIKLRSGLGETLRSLGAGAMRTAFDGGDVARPGSTDDAIPDGASFVSASFAGSDRTLTYKLYVPSGRSKAPRPLIVMLHGCTQSPDDFASGTGMNRVAEEHGCLVAYPAQSASVNAQKCWNWFSPEHQRREAGEPALIAGLTRQVMGQHAVDANRVYVAGLSAGGAAAAVMVTTYPDLYAAAGVHSGLPVGCARDLPSALSAMRHGGRGLSQTSPLAPTIVFHGDHDGTVHPRNSEDIVSAFTSLSGTQRTTMQRGAQAGRRSCSISVHADPSGKSVCEHWIIHGGGHAWAGGHSSGSYTDPQGPDATREMVRFFLQHERGAALA